jgi:hypothetical protein
MRPVIFLDFDGPLLPKRGFYHPDNQTVMPRVYDPYAIGMIEWCATKANAQYVISSTWRGNGRGWIVSLLTENRISVDRLHPDWATPIFDKGSIRTLEILHWLAKHPEVTQWVAIDDMGDPKQLPNLIEVTEEEGFLYSHFEKMCKILKITARIGDQLLISKEFLTS